MLEEIEALIEALLRDAGLRPDAVREVIYTGGSSAIPAVRALLHRLLPSAATRDSAAFTSVAAGLAMPDVESAITV